MYQVHLYIILLGEKNMYIINTASNAIIQFIVIFTQPILIQKLNLTMVVYSCTVPCQEPELYTKGQSLLFLDNSRRIRRSYLTWVLTNRLIIEAVDWLCVILFTNKKTPACFGKKLKKRNVTRVHAARLKQSAVHHFYIIYSPFTYLLEFSL